MFLSGFWPKDIEDGCDPRVFLSSSLLPSPAFVIRQARQTFCEVPLFPTSSHVPYLSLSLSYGLRTSNPFSAYVSLQYTKYSLPSLYFRVAKLEGVSFFVYLDLNVGATVMNG